MLRLAIVLAVAAIGTAGLVLSLLTAAEAGLMSRDALYAVVRSCALAEEHLGTPFPCLQVRPARDGVPGVAVVRAPGRSTHVVVVPTEAVAGIEDPALKRPEAGIYWRVALESRRLVREGSGDRVADAAIGLAMNSDRTRSQDQLHIHAECFRPPVLAAIRSQEKEVGRDWRLLNRPVDRDRFFAREVGAAEIERGNLFAILAGLPGAQGELDGIVTLLVNRTDRRDAYLLLASRTRHRSVEAVLDHGCAATTGRG